MENKGITIEIDYEKLAKALTDLIDQRIDKRLKENVNTINVELGSISKKKLH